jgi:ATP-dependent Clp protease ATP-binding subunit ClpB
MTRMPPGAPHWVTDIDATLPVCSQYIVHGGIRDLHIWPVPAPDDQPRTILLPTLIVLWETLQLSGFQFLLHHSPTGGLQVVQGLDPVATTAAREAAGEVLVDCPAQLGAQVSYDAMVDVMQRVARHPTIRGGLVIDYASQVSPSPAVPDEGLHRLMLASLAEVHGGTGRRLPGTRSAVVHHARFWMVDRPGDLPSWMVGGSDGIRQSPIPLPDLGARAIAAASLARSLPHRPDDAQAASEVVNRFAESTEGMTLRSMSEAVQLAIDSGTPAARVDDSVRAYRVGLLENRWKEPVLRDRILNGETVLNERVLGQPRAIRRVMDILLRSTLGLTSAQNPSAGSGPRGVLFFAGPTGVGKTELAKRMTALVFGDERAYIRFDMSEFSSEHTEARLIGSPPGYVGHGSGGELTNAVRQRPFSVVLFDEIEKAHPKILDKFLQILSDGRLTDGSGATVHFSETVIVFTSNLGVAEAEEHLRTHPEDDYAEVMTAIIRDQFTNPDKFNRPELLGRIGDNIVIFDHITTPVARELAHRFLGNVVSRVRAEMAVELMIPSDVAEVIIQACTADLSKGGRGIGMSVESLVVNPLARALARTPADTHVTLTAYRLEHGEGHVSVK